MDMMVGNKVKEIINEIDDLIIKLGHPRNREEGLTRTKLEEAKFWISESNKEDKE